MVLASSTAFAVLPERKSLLELLDESAIVLTGTVTGISLTRDTKNPLPLTEFRLDHVRPVAGALGRDGIGREPFVLTFAGGMTRAGSFVRVSAMPRLSLGATYVLFLRAGPWYLNPIAGWHQGLFRVVPTRPGGPLAVVDSHDRLVTGVVDGRLEMIPLPVEAAHPHVAWGGPSLRALTGAERDRLLEAMRSRTRPPLRDPPTGTTDVPIPMETPRPPDSAMVDRLLGSAMPLDRFTAAIAALASERRLETRKFTPRPVPLPGPGGGER